MDDDWPPGDARFVEALRRSIDGSDAPGVRLADVQRRADAQQRRRTLGGSVAGGVLALALAGGLAVVLPPPAAAPDRRPVAATADVDDLTDPARWATLPPIDRSRLQLLTTEEVASAHPDDGAWEHGAIADVGGQWAASWCGRDQEVGLFWGDGGGVPAGEAVQAWVAFDGASAAAHVRVDALRWAPAGGEELVSAQDWGTAMGRDAAGCPGAVTLDASAVPGDLAALTAAPGAGGLAPRVAGGRELWRVQATTTGGPTALRLQTTTLADDAEDAGARAAALLTTAVARLVEADRVAADLRDHPADRPALTAGHLLAPEDVGGPGSEVPPLARPAPAAPGVALAGWCEGAPALDVEPPADAWSTAWAEDDRPGEPYDVLAVEQRVLRFTGAGDDAGAAAAQAHSDALRAGALACVDQAGAGQRTSVTEPVGSIEGTDVLVTAVDQGDGTWVATATARDGVTVLVVSLRVQWDEQWYDDSVIATMTRAWSRLHEADGTGP